MEGFAYHIDHNPFLLDSGFFLSFPMDITHVEEPNNNTNHSQFYKSHNNLQGFVPVDITINESGSCLEHVIKKPCVSNNEPCMTNKQSIDSSSLIAKADEIGEQVTQKVVSPMYGRKKYKDDYSLNSAYSKNTKEPVKAKKQMKRNGTKSDVDDKKPRGIDKKDKKKVAAEEFPTGSIPVRAGRGQATDSHSIAERVRRAKISHKMKQLQALVPGCDKVMGKTHMLDEIINYVQSLQNQVEFLSLKLASVNPILPDFEIDLDAFMTTPERLSSINSSQTQTNSFADTSNTFSTYNYPLLDSFSPLLVQHGQMTITLPQGDGQQLWHVNNQRQDFINQSDFNNLCSFH